MLQGQRERWIRCSQVRLRDNMEVTREVAVGTLNPLLNSLSVKAVVLPVVITMDTAVAMSSKNGIKTRMGSSGNRPSTDPSVLLLAY